MADIVILGLSLPLTWFLLIVAVVLFFIYDYYCRTYWARHGVPSAPSLPIFGHLIAFRTAGVYKLLHETRERYGNVFGIYDFRRPVMILSDPDVIKAIMVKEFSYFYNRRVLPLQPKLRDIGVVALRDERWRDVRNVMTPAFSAAKMKNMSPLINECVDNLVEYIGKKQEEDGCIDCTKLYGSFLMDTIAACGFGLKVNSQENPNDPFVKHAKKVFDINLFNPLYAFAMIFPIFAPIFKYLEIGSPVEKESCDLFSELTVRAKELRKDPEGSGKKKNDFLQLIIDAQDDTDDLPEQSEEGDFDVHNALDQHHDVDFHRRNTKKKVKLTDDELTAQGMLFFLAGYETTNTLLGFCSYLLATNPEVQDKLIAEVDDLKVSRDDVGYKSVSKMPYLDQVVCETLRIYPPVTLADRECRETYRSGDFTIPKGMNIWVNIYGIHHNPDIWPQPDKFKPERFTPENREKRHPFAWIPFGGGPRNCIGMRFALMEAKMALIRVLQRYRLETCPQTEIPPKVGNLAFLQPPNGITLRAVPRD